MAFRASLLACAAALFAVTAPAWAEAPAFDDFATFVAGVRTAAAADFVGKPGARVQDAGEFAAMRAHLLSLYDGIGVAHSLAVEDQVFDCVAIADQPSVRLRGLTSIATPPAEPPTPSAAPSGRLRQSESAGESCAVGTIPMRRITLEEITRFATLQDYFAKSPDGSGHEPSPSATAAPPAAVPNQHLYAVALQQVANTGSFGFINLWKPAVATGSGQVFTLAQQWVGAGTGAGVQTVEVGWQNYPAMTKKKKPVLFIYFTPDNYGRAGCYNLACSAFVQTSNSIKLGGTFNHYSKPGGTQWGMRAGFKLRDGAWWLNFGGEWVGYYPLSLFGSGALSTQAARVSFGGETSGTTSFPPMGSGVFASGGYRQAAFQAELVYYDPSGAAKAPRLTQEQPSPSCYTLTAPHLSSDPDWLTNFYFGGPGGAAC